MKNKAITCQRVNTYEVLEHVMGIKGLHPHRLSAINDMRKKISEHTKNMGTIESGVIIDIGCGSGANVAALAKMLKPGLKVVGNAGFDKIDSLEHSFDLMHIPTLFKDYPAHMLIKNFVKNTVRPSPYFGKISSKYILRRTIQIFFFFLSNKNKFAGGEFCAVKSKPTA